MNSLSMRIQRLHAQAQCERILGRSTQDNTADWEKLLGPELTAIVRALAEEDECSPQTIIREAIKFYTKGFNS